MKQETNNNNHIPRIYIRCKQCLSNLCIHNTDQQQINETNQQTIIKNLPSHNNNPLFSNEIIISALHIISNNNSAQMTLKCRKCGNNVGNIFDSYITFFHNSTIQQTITYTYIQRYQRQNKKQLCQFYDKLRAYTNLTNHLLEQKLANIRMDKLTRLHTQLQSFIKFYKQWQSRKSLLSTQRSWIDEGSVCSLGKKLQMQSKM